MRSLVEHLIENLSTKDTFLFRICCGVCDREYANKARRFSKAGLVAQTKEKQRLYDALYEQEFRSARLLAIQDAAEQINYCPICKRLVCNQCFLICDDLDMCKQCAAQLKETGTPVFSEVPESAV